MKNRISKRDWESISAYLDGQLSPRQQARLETKLQKDHQIQEGLVELRNTRDVLRIAPRLTAPRNFMLTPEMVGHPVRLPRLAPVFGWASALAGFLFVLVMMGDLFNAGRFIPAVVIMPNQQEDLALKSQVVQEQVITQPPVAGALEAPVQEIVEQSEREEIFEEPAPMEAPDESVSQSMATQAAIAEREEIEMFTQVTESMPEIQDRRLDPTATGEAFFVSPALAPTVQGETETEPETEPETGPEESSGEINAMELSENPVDPGSVTETAGFEDSQDQVADMPPEEEKITQPQEQNIEQPGGDIIETHPVAVPSPTVTWIPTDVPVVVTQVPDDNTRTVVFGAEVILALFAVGTGLAWFYLRHQGG